MSKTIKTTKTRDEFLESLTVIEKMKLFSAEATKYQNAKAERRAEAKLNGERGRTVEVTPGTFEYFGPGE